MNRKLGLMFAAIVTLVILWVGTTGAAWASPASATVPPGTGSYRLYIATSNGTAQHATYSYFTPIGKVPVGMKFLLKGALVKLYNSAWVPVTGQVVVCGLIPLVRQGQIYKLSGTTWVAQPSWTTITGSTKSVCAMGAPGKFVVIGK